MSILRRRPYIAHFHLDVDPSGRLGVLLAGYKRWILAPFLRQAAAVVALSPQQADFLESHYRVEPERITVIPNGVHPRFYRARDRSESQSAPTHKLRLLFVGRLEEQKNVLRLVDAMADVSAEVELVIVGDGELRDEISRRIEVLGLTGVRLVGAARGNQLVQWHCWADAFVLSSDKEGMPLVLLEAMAGSGDRRSRCARDARDRRRLRSDEPIRSRWPQPSTGWPQTRPCSPACRPAAPTAERILIGAAAFRGWSVSTIRWRQLDRHHHRHVAACHDRGQR